MSEIPTHIIETINTLLAPYGERYTASPSALTGYTNWEGAVKYTSLSKSTLRRAVDAGTLEAPFKVGKGKNGATLFSYDQLDRFVQSAR